METIDLKSAVARILRDGDPNSATNQKLIAAARLITEELRQKVQEEFGGEDHKKLGLGDCHVCGRGSWWLEWESYQWEGTNQVYRPYSYLYHHYSEIANGQPTTVYRLGWQYSQKAYEKPDARLMLGIHHLAADIVTARGYEKWRQEKFDYLRKYSKKV